MSHLFLSPSKQVLIPLGAGSYFNLMIFLVPVAWALHLTHQNDVIVFVFTFLSVIPLANLLSFATEQLALRVGEAIGGLLNASFGNAVEVCSSPLAFRSILTPSV